jgi:predicted transcriptional regulator YdeE
VLHRTGERPLNLAYTALYTWMEHNAYFSAGAPRELLLSDPAQKEEHWQFTEVQLPVHNTQEMKTKLIANPYRKDFEMEPKIVSLPAFQVVGVRYYGKNENQEISQLWQAGNQRFHEIKHITPGSDAYGICVTPPDSPTGEFEYVAGFQVDSGEDIPQGMVSRQVPAHTYAVFTHVGSLEKLRDTYTYIYQVWLPQSGYKLASGLDFERYDEDFKDFSPDSRFYIYVPIE